MLALRDEVLGDRYRPELALREVSPILKTLQPFFEAEELDTEALQGITQNISGDPAADIGAFNELTRILEGYSGERQRRKYRRAFAQAQQAAVLPHSASYNPENFDPRSYELLKTILLARREADLLRRTVGDRFEDRYDAPHKLEIGRGSEKRVFLVTALIEEDGDGNPKKYIAARYDRVEHRGRHVITYRAQSQIDHPNIEKVVEMISDKKGNVWIISEHIEGSQTLKHLLGLGEGHRDLSVEQIHSVLNQLIFGAAHVYEQHGIVHRDLKPSNVLAILNNEGSVEIKIFDFGVAKFLGEDTRTAEGRVGTEGYMAPEVLDLGSGTIGHPTDLYSIGIIGLSLLLRSEDWIRKGEDPVMKLATLRDKLPKDVETMKLLDRLEGLIDIHPDVRLKQSPAIFEKVLAVDRLIDIRSVHRRWTGIGVLSAFSGVMLGTLQFMTAPSLINRWSALALLLFGGGLARAFSSNRRIREIIFPKLMIAYENEYDVLQRLGRRVLTGENESVPAADDEDLEDIST